MHPFNIKFQVYIPKNLGKSLLDYFNTDPRCHPDRMINYEEFKRKLTSSEIASHHWLPEPVFYHFRKTYCSIDDGVFHRDGKHPNHSIRLGFDLWIDPSKIGNYFFESKESLFRHQAHNIMINKEDVAIAGNQHSGTSHQVQAYIRPVIGMPHSGPHMYKGVCERPEKLRSEEKAIGVKVFDTKNDLFGCYTKSTQKDTTLFQITADASYPFLQGIAPAINFDFTIRVHLAQGSNTVHINVNGKHDKFPAYELLVDDTIIYTHAPTHALEFMGLTESHPFQAHFSKSVHRWGVHAF